MIYTANYIENNFNFKTGDDVELSFIIRDQWRNLVTDYSDIGILAEMAGAFYWGGQQTQLGNAEVGGSDTEISVDSNGIFTIFIPNSETENYHEGKYRLEIRLNIEGKKYTVYSELFFFTFEIIDFDKPAPMGTV